MLRHIVLMRLKKNVSEHEINTLFDRIRELQKYIPQILNFSYGLCDSPENLHQDFMYGFTMDFKNKTDRDAYLEHSQHKQVSKNYIMPLLEDGVQSIVVFDYVFS